jgi:hypothetical protein
MARRDDAVDELERAWTAQAVCDETDRITGEHRKAMADGSLLAAAAVSARIRPHPLDPAIGGERDRKVAYYRPTPGAWWQEPYRVAEAKVCEAVIYGLLWVRKGLRPVEAARFAAGFARRKLGLESHHADRVALRVYHCCRLAGLDVI